jgi:hypothetical protein
MLALRKENGHALLTVCNLHIEFLNRICSGSCSVMAWVLGFGSGLAVEIDYHGFPKL